MEQILQRIRETIHDKNNVYVFPSELTAAFWLRESLIQTKAGAVSKARFISWDRFKEEAFLLSAKDSPVNNIIRSFFVEREFEEHRKAPLYPVLLPSGFPEALSGFRKDILKLLPELHGLIEATESKNWNICADLRLLYGRYSGFLKTYALFEPSRLEPLLNDFDKTYLIFLPELIEDYRQFASALSACGRIRCFSGNEPDIAELHEFSSQKNELRWLFQQIMALHTGGADIHDIAVSVPELDEIKDQLDHYSRLYAVPLSVRQGRPLSEFSGNRMWRMIAECVSSGFSYKSLKNLLMNRGIPFKEERAYTGFIRSITGMSCAGNWYENGRPVDFIRRQLRKGGLQAEEALYASISNDMRKITSASCFKDLRTGAQRFINTYLDTGRWEDGVMLRAFQAGLDLLNDYCAAEERMQGMRVQNPMSIWLEALNSKGYVDSESAAGVPVYPYRVAAGIAPRYHFVINASAANIEAKSRRYLVLTDEERAELEECGTDFTRDFVNSYADSGKRVFFSFSRTGFVSTGLPPAVFMENGTIVRVDESSVQAEDPAAGERSLWRNGTVPPYVYPWQKYGAGFFIRSLPGPGSPDMAAQPVGDHGLPLRRDGDGNIELSPTGIDNYRKCPFRYCMEDLLRLEPGFHDMYLSDPRVIGILEHRVLRDYAGEVRPDDARGETVIGILTDKVMGEYERTHPVPLPPEWRRIRETVKDLLSRFPAAESEILGGYGIRYCEERFAAALEGGVTAAGIIDRVSADRDGGLFIVDYKKKHKLTAKDYGDSGDGLPTSIQIPFYAYLLETSGQKVTGAAYYSVEDAKFDIVFSGNHAKTKLDAREFHSYKEILTERFPAYVRAFKEGRFTVTQDENNCDNCGYRPVCRARYTIRSG